MPQRIGQGTDIHRLIDGRPLWLGGVRIPFSQGLLGHSDGDVVLHAICDPRYAGIASAELTHQVAARMREQGWRIANLDVTVSTETPRLAPHRDAMRARVAELLGAAPTQVNIKAKTNEGLDAVGNGQAIAATAVVLLISDRG
jgi:2-C-methyl-D-erythritol 2,4-cyclodiphosphate synthase